MKQTCFQGYPESAICVQDSHGSRNFAIHNAYHTLLRSSSIFEPRHPSLKVVRTTIKIDIHSRHKTLITYTNCCTENPCSRRQPPWIPRATEVTPPHSSLRTKNVCPRRVRSYFTVKHWMRVNDPSAGSPTETLLRLLLPLVLAFY